MNVRRLAWGVLLCAASLVLMAACGTGPAPQGLEQAVLVGHWDRVEGLASSVASNDPSVPEVTVLRAYAALLRGDSKTAVRNFLRVRSAPARTQWLAGLGARYPDRPIARLLTGDALARQGDTRGASAHFDVAVRLEPGFSLARLGGGVLRGMAGERETARRDLGGLSAAGPVAAEALVAKSQIHLEQGSLEDAYADLRRALELSPEHPVAHNTLGILCARKGDWVCAGRHFETAFRLAPELAEARRNWQIARAAKKRGAQIASQGTVGSITLVVADKANMNALTGQASDAVRGQTGQTPFIVANPQEAAALAGSRNVILQVPNEGLQSVAGDKVLGTLNIIGQSTQAQVNVFAQGNEATDNAAMGINRHLNGAPPGGRANIAGAQFLDPSEMSGAVGKTPLGVTDMKSTAGMLGQVAAQGVPTAVYTVEGKPGTQHMGNVTALQNTTGVDVYSTQWKGGTQTSLSVSPSGIGASIGISNATDQASNRADQSPRDWMVSRDGTKQILTGSAADFTQNYVNAQQLPPFTSIPSSTPGGVSVGPIIVSRGTGGRVVFNGGDREGAELALVSTLFPRASLSGKDRDARAR